MPFVLGNAFHALNFRIKSAYILAAVALKIHKPLLDVFKDSRTALITTSRYSDLTYTTVAKYAFSRTP